MIRPLLLAAALVGWASWAAADEPLHLAIKDHRFAPDHLEAPAGVKFRLLVRNDDATAEEFESNDLRREKIVAAGQEITVSLGPLEPGEYRFFGDFHKDTAQGVLVAK